MAQTGDSTALTPPGDIKASRWLAALTREVRAPLAVSVALGFVQGLCMIAQAGLVAVIVHGLVIAEQSRAALGGPFAALLGVFALRAATVWGMELAGQHAAAAVKYKLRRAFFERLAALGPAFLARRTSGGVVSAGLDQIEALEGYVARFAPQMGVAVIVPLTMVVAAFAVDWVAGLVLLVAAPFVPVLMTVVGMRAEDASQAQVQALNHLSGYLLDRLRGLVTLKLFGRGADEVAGVARASEDFRQRTMQVLRLAFLSSAILEAFAAITVAIIAIWVGFALAGYIGFGPAAGMSLAAGLFVLLLAPDFFLPLRQLGQYYHDRAQAIGAVGPLIDVLQHSPADPGLAGRQLPAERPLSLRLAGVTFAHPEASRPVLSDFDLTVAAGEAVALAGPSGVGKSTVLELILGFLTPQRGAIALGGVPVQELAPEARSAAVAWVGQRTHLFAGSLRANIRLSAPSAPDSQVEAAADAAGVTVFARDLPHGLDSAVGERGYGLSGGQARRVALARAFLADSPILLLDEPTAGLDPASERAVLAGLDRLRPGRTVIVATHDPTALAWTDRVVTLAAPGRDETGSQR